MSFTHSRQSSKREHDYRTTLNLPKGEFDMKELKFYGYYFRPTGLLPAPEKVRAIKECTKSKAEIHSFIRMTGYLSKFILK